jgi:putative Mn2+ efflux pump MntP
MGFIEIILIATGLAMDSFAVALGAAATGKLNNKRAVFRISFHFGLFQALLPLVGWFLGVVLEPLAGPLSHWIAFLLLIYVGVHMVQSGMRAEAAVHTKDPSRGSRMVMLSLATSLDAFAIGVSLAMLNLTIWYPVLIIGLVTSLVSLIGIYLGRRLHALFGQRMEIAGGVIIILIGFRILWDILI